MNNPRIRRSGTYALKYLGPASSSEVNRIAQLSQRLCEMGIPTPKATYLEKAHLLKMPWLDGLSGKTLVLKVLSQAMLATGEKEIRRNLLAILAPLVKLHDVDPDTLKLKPFDPWRKITSRLASWSREGRGFSPEATRLEQHLRNRTADVLRQTSSQNLSVVHGDFHAGQIFFGSKPRMSWLLDLGDLGLGHKESDLGNLSAYLATARETTLNDINLAYEYWSFQVSSAYEDITKQPMNRKLIDAYGAIALLHRGLKQWERTGDKHIPDNIFDASRRASERQGTSGTNSLL